MRSDERFAREVARLLEVDDLIRQGAEPDERAFLEALKLRLSTEHAGGAFLRELERRVRRGTSVPRRPWLAWTLAAAVVVAIALIVLFWPKGRGGPPIEAEAPPRVVLPAAAPGEDFAVVVQLLLAEWEKGAGLNLSEGDLLSARRLSLRSGQVTLAFLSGVTLTLEGPADLELISIDRVFCHRGKLRARVPDGAEGFVVAAPGSAVIDR